MAPSAAALAPSNYQPLVSAIGVPTTLDILFGAEQPNNYLGIKQNGASTGKSAMDSVEARYALPFQGANPSSISARVAGVLPSSAVGNKVILQFGEDTERNRIRLVWDSSGTIRFIVTYVGVEQVNISLGSLAGGSSFDVSFSAQLNLFFAQLNGGIIQQDVAGGMPGVGKMWVGQSGAGENFDGTISKVQIFSQRMPSDDLWAEGDSYVAGDALLTSLTDSLQTNTNRKVFSSGVGGSTLTNQRDRVLANPGFASNNTLVHWDGYANGYGTNSADMAKYAAMAGAITTGRYVFLTPLTPPSGATDINAAAAALRTSLLSAYPNNCYDAQAFVDTIPSPYQPDGIHLSDSTMDLVAIDLDRWMRARSL